MYLRQNPHPLPNTLRTSSALSQLVFRMRRGHDGPQPGFPLRYGRKCDPRHEDAGIKQFTTNSMASRLTTMMGVIATSLTEYSRRRC